VQQAMMGIDLIDPAPGVTKLKDVQAAWLGLAEVRFAAVPSSAPKADVDTTPDVSADVVLLDLSGVACPMNFVKTKIKLSTMPIGSLLDVILDDGAPIENVPLSLEEQGQKVESKEKISDTQWKIRVEKTGQI
jgi:sulfite reductase (NADPH) hemoprotein beta-component/sulfite reductase (ferredoxin)